MSIGRELISEDGKVVVMLCSQLGLNSDGGASALAPLTLSEWNTLARKIHESVVKRPGALLGLTAKSLTEQLTLTKSEAERIVELLERGGSVAIELERLASRGIWCVTRADDSYPARLRNTLKQQAPVVLFGAGELSILQKPSVAIIGSRNLDERGQEFARTLGNRCARESLAVVSGGARGTDRIAMQAALESDGVAVGALADSLEKTVRQPDVREFVSEGRLVLLTPYQPDNGFSVGAAMGRNKVIYGLADYAIVVASDYEKGGTWAGAVEALKAEWCPVFVRSGEDTGVGNEGLIKRGAIALPSSEFDSIAHIADWMRTHVTSKLEQAELLPATVKESSTSYGSRNRSNLRRKTS
jgi:predicted Rossmann fold nucleotide-binding protein DprA/Smf involved in DNA uptake